MHFFLSRNPWLFFSWKCFSVGPEVNCPVALSMLWSLWAYSAFICVCLCLSMRRRKKEKIERDMTPHDVAFTWNGTSSFHSLHHLQILDSEALWKQPQPKHSLEIFHKMCVCTSKNKLPSWLKLQTLSSVVLHAWHWQALGLCAARAQEQQQRRRNHPVCRQTAAVGPVTHRRAAAVTLKCTKP